MTTTEQKLIAEYKESHPVNQSFHTGLWGYERVMDCLNLNKCTYKSELSAKQARGKAAREYAQMQIAMENE